MKMTLQHIKDKDEDPLGYNTLKMKMMMMILLAATTLKMKMMVLSATTHGRR
uniref:Uncharacterized protein n=1 Tax=Cucumis melo TaxID=3656 RepID=A0A9I9E9C0_CUCME